MARGTKQLVQELSRPGDAEVLRGDLALVGLPGVVYAPARGLGLPAVAVGHGWLQPAARYRPLLRHLASWGIVALAPDTQRGPLASAAALAADLRTALDVGTGVRLGTGQISVDPSRLGLVGHGIGGGAAVLAAATPGTEVRALVLLAPAETHPSAIDAARSVSKPGLVLIAGKDHVAPAAGHAEPIVAAWSGKVTARCLPKASHLGFLQGRHWADALVQGKPERRTHRLTLALTTAFLLRSLTGTSKYDELLDGDVKGAELVQPALL
jgi:dienelactone hydrolase